MARAELFLAGDVMTGRGVDQIQRHPGRDALRESYIQRASDYVELAERVSGPIRRGVEPAYVWGEALAELERARPDASIVNLETSLTRRDGFWPDKEVHYRMHPANVGCLTAAHVDVCALANNHVLDFGRAGLTETLAALDEAHLGHAGAGATLEAAQRPARVALDGGAILVLAFGHETSGIPPEWAAGVARSGVDLLPDLSLRTADAIGERVAALKGVNDVVVASIHWGSNWGYEVSGEQRAFARRLVERGVDVVHGHSSHHVRPVEVYRGSLILYGCGDLITDYEGIRGHEAWRGDLGALYFATLESGALQGLRLVPTKLRKLRLTRASRADGRALRDALDRISAPFGARFEETHDGELVLRT